MHENLVIFAGSASTELGKKISLELRLTVGDCSLGKFSDGEISVEINQNVRGKDVFVVQSICTPVNDSLVELILMIDALRRSSARRITAVVPYFGYARQDRRPHYRRVPISAKAVANILDATRVDRILTVDLHADQIQGFFQCPIDNLYASKVVLEDINKHRSGNEVIVSPDIGGVLRARAIATRLDDAELAIIDKRRSSPNQSQVINIIGKVEGKSCILVDDIIDTAGTVCLAAAALKEKGAYRVYVYGVHPVLSGPAIARISASVIDEVVVSDSMPLTEEAKKTKTLRQISIAGLIAKAVLHINREQSIRSLLEGTE